MSRRLPLFVRMENRISVRVVRNDTCVSWGFRISGGRDFGAPVTIQRVNPSSVADRYGLRAGDLLISIDGKPTSEMKHTEVQMEIKNTEKVLNLELERRDEPPTTRPAPADPSPAMAQLKVDGKRMEQPIPGNRQPFQGVTTETTIPTPFRAFKSTEEVEQQPKAGLSSTPSNPPAPPPLSSTQATQPAASWPPPPPPAALAARPASMGDDESPSVTPVSTYNTEPAALRPYGSPAPPPPQVAPKPPTDRKFSADANVHLSNPAPWKPQDDRKGSLDTSIALSESGLRPVGCRKSSWDPASGQSYVAQSWKPPSANSSVMKQPGSGSATPQNQGSRKGSVDKTSTPATTGYTPTAQPWRAPVPSENNDRRPSSDKSSTLPPMGYVAKPWKAPVANDVGDRRPSWEKSSTLPPSGQSTNPYDTSSVDTSSSLPPSQSWKIKEGERKGSLPSVNERPAAKKHEAGTCFHCKETIRGPYLMAMDRTYCADHFRCCKCNTKLDSQPFVPYENEIYCKEDYGKYIAEKCDACGYPVLNECLRAMNQAFHPQCFTCSQCLQPIAPGNFRIGSDNKRYCEEDWKENFQIMCCRCDFPIEPDERFIEALNKSFHAECFECVACGMKLEGKPFYNRNDKPYCREHVPAH